MRYAKFPVPSVFLRLAGVFFQFQIYACETPVCSRPVQAKELDETGILLAGVQILLASAAHDWP